MWEEKTMDKKIKIERNDERKEENTDKNMNKGRK